MRLFKIIFMLVLANNLIGQTRYELTVNKPLVEKSRYIALDEVGITEWAGNRGIPDTYNRAIGNSMGSPYCQAGQYWCYFTACEELNINKKYIPMPRNGLANSTYDFFKKHGKKTKYVGLNNDFIVWKSIYKYTGHIERIIKTLKSGWVKTVAFNAGQPEGVYIKKRHLLNPLNRIKRIRGVCGVRSV